MTRADVPEFVHELLAVGAETWAITPTAYVVGDIDVPRAVSVKVQQICDRFGERDHLRADIARYLISIGRVADWADS